MGYKAIYESTPFILSFKQYTNASSYTLKMIIFKIYRE